MSENKPSGRSRSGHARAASLTSEQRKAIAKKGGLARWGHKATHKGNFKDEFGIDIECYVLNDENKTAVISQRGMALAIGISERASSFTRFLECKGMQDHASAQLLENLSQPIKFQGLKQSTQNGRSAKIHGFDVTLLIDICKAIIKAEENEDLNYQQRNIATQANIILSASAKSGIKGLVYALSGYDAKQQEIINSFKMFIKEEAREYEKEFPEQLYLEWHRIYNLPIPKRNRPWKFMHLTKDQVYRPLARSNGKIFELTKSKRSEDKRKRLHQFLSEIGVKALRQHLGQLLGIAQVSGTKEVYERNISKVFGGQIEFDV